jgi:hypothetical protein
MIIHSPIVSGSLTFASGATFALPAGGVYSGSFSGSITGIGDPATFSASLENKISQLNVDTGSQDARLDLLESYTSSQDTKNSTISTYTASLESKNSTLATYTGSIDTKFSTLGTYTGSVDTKNSTLGTYTASLETYTASLETKNSTLATYTGSNDTKWSTLGSLSGSFARTNSDNTFSGLQTFSNINVEGTASFAFIQSTTGSSTNIGESFIILNQQTPASNFAGIKVIDSGSSFTTASFIYDGLTNNWIFEKANVGSSDTSIAIFGPISTDGLGTEVGLTENTLPKAVSSHGHHIGNSNITDTGTLITLGSNTVVNGTIYASGTTIISGSSQVTLSSTTGGGTSANVQFNSLGIGMAASATAGRIDATNDIVAYSSSDIRFKENIKPIENPLEKISKISGNTYDWKQENQIEHGYEGNDVGVIAQEIEEVLPQLVQTRENGYKAVKYDKLVALLIEGIKEQQSKIEELTNRINKLENGL